MLRRRAGRFDRGVDARPGADRPADACERQFRSGAPAVRPSHKPKGQRTVDEFGLAAAFRGMKLPC